MATAAFSATRRRNVSPTSSTLKVQTRDVDCSTLATPPEDGQFITADGTVTTGVFMHAANIAGLNGANANHLLQGPQLVMVWGSAQRSDRQALGDTRVATLAHGGIEVQCSLYNATDAALLNGAGNYPVGTLVTVANAASAVEGTANRLVLEPYTAAGVAWVVGQVVAAPAQAGAADRPITVYLFDKPRLVGQD